MIEHLFDCVKAIILIAYWFARRAPARPVVIGHAEQVQNITGHTTVDQSNVNTEGGTYVEGHVDTGSGDFVAGDKHVASGGTNASDRQGRGDESDLDCPSAGL